MELRLAWAIRENRQWRCTRARYTLHLFLSPTMPKMALGVRPFGGMKEQEQVVRYSVWPTITIYRKAKE
jgi:hypothetical protein